VNMKVTAMANAMRVLMPNPYSIALGTLIEASRTLSAEYECQ
jgi:hypothetical protein